MKLSLGHRIFIAFSGLLVLILATIAGITYYRGNNIAERAVADALDNIRTVQERYESQRFWQLGLISEMFASDPYFSSYVAEAAGSELDFGGEGVDSDSIFDLLSERQQDLGFDIAMVLNDVGEVIARTDGSELIQEDISGAVEDLSGDSLVGSAIESLELTTGYWFREELAYQVAVVPLADQNDLVGFLLTGLVINNQLANDIKKISGSELIFLEDIEGSLKTVASTFDLEESDGVMLDYGKIKAAVDAEPIEIQIANKRWLASVAHAGSLQSGGLTIALTSIDEAFADFRAIQKALLIVMAISILLALPLSLMISRGVLAPVRRLAEAAQAAARGNYQQTFKSDGKDEVARLTGAFDSLLSDLREKSDMEGYMSELAKYLPDSLEVSGVKGKGGNERTPSKRGDFSLLGLDLRRFAKKANETAPQEVMNIFNASVNNIDVLAKAYSGRVLAVVGHRVLVLFEGQESYKQALVVAGNVLATMHSDGEGIAAAVVNGDAVLGTAELGENSKENIVGMLVYQLERLLQETVSGQIFVTPNLREEVKSEHPEIEFFASQGLVSKKKFYALKSVDGEVFNIESEEETMQGTQVTQGGSVVKTRVHVAPGTSLGGRYEIISELGAGGMGVVYKAHDNELNDLVALKMLKLSGLEGAAEFLEAMKSEIRLARKITHPTILRTYDYGELEGVPYISMEYVRGLTLKYLLEQSGKLPYSAGIRIAKQVAAGLQTAHEQSVLHRDIKPENIILEQSGNAKIMDFGIARQVKGPGLGELEGLVVGTPRYAAPEQLRGETVDMRADIYSAGIVFYQMCTGKVPFSMRNFEKLVEAKSTQAPTRPSHYWPEIPPDVEELILCAIATDPAERFASAQALLEALEKLRV